MSDYATPPPRDELRELGEKSGDRRGDYQFLGRKRAIVIRREGDSILFVSEKGPEGRIQLRADNVSGSQTVAKRLQ